MRDIITIGQLEPGQEPDVEPLAVPALSLAAHAQLLAIEASTPQIAQLAWDPSTSVTDSITLDDGAIEHSVSGVIVVVEHLVDQGLAITRVEVAPYL